MRSLRLLAGLTLLLVILAACGGNDGDDPTATAPPATQPPATSMTEATATTAATVTAVSTATIQPSTTVTTATTATAISTATPEPTTTATATPAPTPTPTPTPTPDPVVYNDIIFGDLVVDTGGEHPEGVGGIFAIDADGSDLHSITNTPDGWGDTWPAVSPDGTRMAFSRSRGGLTEEQGAEGGVYVVDIATGEEWPIVNGRAVAVWSPDGSQLLMRWQEHTFCLACCGGGNDDADPPRIAVANADDSDLRVLYDAADDAGAGAGVYVGWEPAWSPDGSRVLFFRAVYQADGSSRPVLTVVNANSSARHDIDTGPITPQDVYQWSPDGSTIVFVGVDGQFPDPGLFSIASDGSRLTRLTSPDIAVAHDSAISFTTDDAGIVFRGYIVNPRSADPVQSLYVVAPDGSRLTQLTSPDVSAGQFVLSPDGTKIALWAWDPSTETSTLLVMNAEGSTFMTIDAPQSGGYGMAWSPDSTRLVYLAYPDPRGTANQLLVVDASTGTVSPALALVRVGEGVTQPVWRPTGE